MKNALKEMAQIIYCHDIYSKKPCVFCDGDNNHFDHCIVNKAKKIVNENISVICPECGGKNMKHFLRCSIWKDLIDVCAI